MPSPCPSAVLGCLSHRATVSICRTFVLVGMTIGGLGFSNAAGPSYSHQVGAKVDYRISVGIGAGESARKYSGELSYAVESANNGLIRLKVSGYINGKRRSYGPSMNFGFSQNRSNSLLPELEHVSISGALIGIDSRGHVQTSSGDESISFLLGKLGQLALPPLPANGQMKWSQNSSIQVTELDRSRDSFMPPGFGGNRTREGDVSVADEKTDYEITSIDRQPALIMGISHQYQLTALHTDPPLHISGDGTAKFDANLGFVDSLQINRLLNLTRDGAEFKVPISVSLRRKTEAEKVAEADAAAAKKAERERSFTDAERRKWLHDLRPGSRDYDAVKVLTTLSQFDERLEPELAAALMSRGDSEEHSSNWYHQASRFDPKLKVVANDRRDYSRSRSSVSRTGAPIQSPRMLRPGQIVAVSRDRFSGYQAAKVVAVQGNLVTYCEVDDDPNDSSKQKVKPYSQFRSAPETIEQPALRRSSRTPSSATRTEPHGEPGNVAERDQVHQWTDKTGQFTVRATFIAVEDGRLKLRSEAGKTIEVPLSALRESDAERAREFAVEPVNPFEVISD